MWPAAVSAVPAPPWGTSVRPSPGPHPESPSSALCMGGRLPLSLLASLPLPGESHNAVEIKSLPRPHLRRAAARSWRDADGPRSQRTARAARSPGPRAARCAPGPPHAPVFLHAPDVV